MKKQKVKKLPVVDKDDRIIGMYVWNDIKQDHRKRDTFSLDEDGHFLVGAAIGLGMEDMARVELLVQRMYASYLVNVCRWLQNIGNGFFSRCLQTCS